MSAYSVRVSPELGALWLLVALSSVLLVLWLVPGFRRSWEQPSRELLTIRAMTVCSAGWISSSEVLTRLTLYTDGLAWCWMAANSYDYKSIGIERPYSSGDICLRISIHGVSARIYGLPESLEEFAAILEGQVVAAAGSVR